MLASLPMYDLPEVRAATDAWWRAVARALRQAGFEDVPDALTRAARREEVWRSPELLLTQTCGYPLRFDLAGSLSACAAPVYAAPGCDGHLYSSALVAREDDPARRLEEFRGRAVAANAPDSQSGCNCLRAMVAPLAVRGRFFARVEWTGAHRASLEALREAVHDASITAARAALLIDDVVPVDDGAYEPVVEMRASARALGYQELDGARDGSREGE